MGLYRLYKKENGQTHFDPLIEYKRNEEGENEMNPYKPGDKVFDCYTVTGELDCGLYAYSCVDAAGGGYTLQMESCSAEYRKRFLDRYARWEKLDHPGVPRPIACEETEGGFLVLAQPDLSKLRPVTELFGEMRACNHPDDPSSTAVEPVPGDCHTGDILLQSAQVLSYLARQGFVHGDVKPANLHWDADTGTLILSDFLLLEGGYTPAYCSMEQLNGKTLTPATDCYSWAVSVMDLHLGGRPWPNGVVAGLNCEKYLGEIGCNLPMRDKTLLKRCLSMESEKRPGWEEIIRELKRTDPNARGYGAAPTAAKTMWEAAAKMQSMSEISEAADRKCTADSKFRLLHPIDERAPFRVYAAEATETGKSATLLLPIGNAEDASALKMLYHVWAVCNGATTSASHGMPPRPRLMHWQSPVYRQRELRYLFTFQPYGESLDAWLKDRLPLDISTALELTGQLLTALSFLHRPGVTDCGDFDGRFGARRALVHRCVAPRNIRISGGDVPQLLLDGFENAVDAWESGLEPCDNISNAFCGVPPFASRRQLFYANNPAPEWDVWAAAACLYYMLTGKYPREFSGNALLCIAKKPTVPICARLPNCPDRLAALIGLALDDTGELRFSSAMELYAALMAIR